MAVIKQLEQLVDAFERDIQLAKELNSPNSRDDRAIRMAIIGFSYTARTEDWDLGHFEFVSDRLAREFDSAYLKEYGQNGGNVRLFFALSIGYLLGLYHKCALSNEEFRLAEHQLAGLVMLHLGRLTARPA